MSVGRKARSTRSTFVEALEARQLLSAVDVTPTIAVSTLPPSVIGGGKIHGSVKVAVANSSAATVKDHATVALYASGDGTVDGSATLVTTVPHSLNIKVGHSQTVTVPVHSIPASVADGTYTLVAQVTDTSGVIATTTGPSIVVAAPFVSISASNYVVKPVAITIGKSVSLAVTITNNGNITTTGSGSFNLGLSSDGETETNTLTALNRPLHIKPGKSKTVRTKLKVPARAPTGQFFPFISVTLDGSTSSTLGSRITIG